MTALYLLGASSKALPKLDNNLKQLKSFRTSNESGASFLEDAIILAKNPGNRTVEKILRRYYRRYQMLQVLKMLDGYMLAGIFRRIYLRVTNPNYLKMRVFLRGSQRWDI